MCLRTFHLLYLRTSAPRLDDLCVWRGYSAYLGCNRWLFESLLTFFFFSLFYNLEPVCPLSCDTWHPQARRRGCVKSTLSTWMFGMFSFFTSPSGFKGIVYETSTGSSLGRPEEKWSVGLLTFALQFHTAKKYLMRVSSHCAQVSVAFYVSWLEEWEGSAMRLTNQLFFFFF